MRPPFGHGAIVLLSAMQTEAPAEVSPSPSATDDVRDYYDQNTRSFLRWGQGRGTGTIRRAIWGPGVEGRVEAFHYVDAEIARRLRLGTESGMRVVDLGCGV